jgi:hypothetical protein
MLSLNEEIKNCSQDRLEEFHEEIIGTYRSVVAESFGTIVEEEEQTLSKQPEEDTAQDQKTETKKAGRKRVLFGFRG